VVERLWSMLDRPARPVAVWAPVIAWAGLVFALSSQPDLRFVPNDLLDFVVRKVGHAGVFGILALLLWRAVSTTTSLREPWAWALALTVLYAVTDELHQGVVSGRHASPVDVGVDALGAVIAVAVAGLVRARRGRAGANS
jgi:VanZ family protein